MIRVTIGKDCSYCSVAEPVGKEQGGWREMSEGSAVGGRLQVLVTWAMAVA